MSLAPRPLRGHACRVALGSVIFTSQGTLARVATVGGTPRDVAEQVEYADWSPGGELAIVTGGTAGRTLEFPVGKPLFHTAGWISDVRFSHRGDRIAFVHHPVFGDDMGEVMLLGIDGPRAGARPSHSPHAGAGLGAG